MNTKEKFGCVITIARFVVTIPLQYVLWFLLLKHIEATDAIWLIFWISAPLTIMLTLLLEIGGNIINPKNKD